jgi:hypothetical protein
MLSNAGRAGRPARCGSNRADAAAAPGCACPIVRYESLLSVIFAAASCRRQIRRFPGRIRTRGRFGGHRRRWARNPCVHTPSPEPTPGADSTSTLPRRSQNKRRRRSCDFPTQFLAHMRHGVVFCCQCPRERRLPILNARQATPIPASLSGRAIPTTRALGDSSRIRPDQTMRDASSSLGIRPCGVS